MAHDAALALYKAVRLMRWLPYSLILKQGRGDFGAAIAPSLSIT